MSLGLEAVILGLVLSADSFSAAVALGFRPFCRRDVLRLAAVTCLAAVLSIWVGALAGAQIIEHIAAYDHWVAFSLLLAVALHMAHEAWQGLRDPASLTEQKHFHGWLKIIMVSFATSLDALGVGLGLGVTSKPIAIFLVAIGVFALSSTVLGLYLARKLSLRFGPIVTLIGSLVLIAMSVQMLKI